MKIYQVSFDSCLLTVISKDEKNLLNILISEDEHFYQKDSKIYYDFGSMQCECYVEDKTDHIGIIQWESH